MLSDLFDKLLDVLSLSVVEVEDVDTLLLSLFVVVVSSSTFFIINAETNLVESVEVVEYSYFIIMFCIIRLII